LKVNKSRFSDKVMLGSGNLTRRELASALFIALPACLACATVFAEDARIRSIAIPDFVDRSLTEQDKGRELARLLASDLNSSGRFLVPNQDQYPNGIVAVDSVPKFEVWRASHVEYLVAGAIALKSDGREMVEFRLWDVAAGQLIFGAQYFVALDQWRRAPHVIADAIFERLTGQAGGFDKQN
jgi:TolB protein